MQYEFNKPITTVGELKQYIGKPIYFYYNFEDVAVSFQNADRKKVYYAWIKQITSIHSKFQHSSGTGEVKDSDTIDKISTKGLNSLQVVNNNSYRRQEENQIQFIHDDDATKEYTSNAQRYARTLTKEEFNMYKDKTRNRRYGYIHNT